MGSKEPTRANLAGGITSETYPSGRTVTTGYDIANRENNIGLGGSPAYYATSFSYWPTDAPQSFTAGHALFARHGLNGKLQPACDMVSSGTLPNSSQACQDQGANYLSVFTYSWGTTTNNGNLQSGSEGYGSSVPYGSLAWLNQTYAYDNVNRLQSVTDTGYSRGFNYDQFGNMWISAASVINPAGNAPTGQTSYNAQNQITTGMATCDNAGEPNRRKR